MKKFLFIVIISLLSVAVLTACDPNPETAIIGSWECRDETYDHIYLCRLTFHSDGRFTDRDGDAGDWRISGNNISLVYDDYDIQHTFTLDFRGNNRVIITSDGFTTMLHRR